MSRRNQLTEIDPFAVDGHGSRRDAEEGAKRPTLSMNDADAALFGELARRDMGRQVVKPISIFNIYPDVKQPRRPVPGPVREHWSGEPRDVADLFNAWLKLIDQERKQAGYPPFNLDHHLWTEAVERQQRDEDDLLLAEDGYQPGPIEAPFLKVVELAVSIRRDGLVNPVTVQRTGSDRYQLETGERRWLAYHILFGYFNGDSGKPQERASWETVPASIVDDFSVWRQASENTARADLNAIGRARQFALLMMDLLGRTGEDFEPFEALVKRGQCDRVYYAQVIPYRVPKGKGELLSNGLGVAHRAAFTRCRTLLSLPDEVWAIGDNLDLPEDELLRIARIQPPQRAVQEAQKVAAIVANRNKPDSDKPPKKPQKSPTLFNDRACKRGKRLFSRQNEFIAKELLSLRDGVGQASPSTKQQIRHQIEEMRRWLETLEAAVDGQSPGR
jgi:hypothetical protein